MYVCMYVCIYVYIYIYVKHSHVVGQKKVPINIPMKSHPLTHIVKYLKHPTRAAGLDLFGKSLCLRGWRSCLNIVDVPILWPFYWEY